MTICKYVREGVNTRIGEARELLSAIKDDTKQGAPQASSALSLTLRGLIYVSLYGSIEYSITQGTQSFINYLCGLKVSIKHLEHSLYSVALNSHLTSAHDSSERRKWETRRAIFSEMNSTSVCSMPDTVFGSFLHNVYPSTIQEIFLCLGIRKSPTATGSDIGYFKEITEKRNAVAHGRESAGDVGKGLTVGDIEIRLSSAYSICSYFLDAMEEHASDLRFLRSRHRAAYRNLVST